MGGKGPDEIANLGFVGSNGDDNEFYVSDHGKQRIVAYKMDSLLADSMSAPSVKVKMNGKEFPNYYHYISDTLAMAIVIKPTGHAGFNQSVARWNMKENTFIPLPYTHPQLERERFALGVSAKQDRYVKGYCYNDLMTICDLSGNLISNVYGSGWTAQENTAKSYYRKVDFYKDKIIALYSGDKRFKDGKAAALELPTQLVVFDREGNYIQTLEVGYSISDFCCDEDNQRLLLNFNDDIQFGYIDLKGIL